MSYGVKRVVASLICLFILGPMLPLYFLRNLAEWTVYFLDWAVEGRAWTKPFLVACDWVQKKMGVEVL
jgi:hypothetical protein